VTCGLDPNVRLKPSGVEWLGDVPEHWEMRRLKTLCRMKSGDGITAMSIEPAGEYPVYGGNGVRGYTSNYTHDGEFALIGRQGALCGNIHLVRGRFWASEHAVVATLYRGYNIEWFGAILTITNLNQYSIAAAQPGLAVERILTLWLPVPPAQEQVHIAKYIEHETADITKAVDRTQREISLILEYRTRLTADVVTGKLDVRAVELSALDEVESPEDWGEDADIEVENMTEIEEAVDADE
jgi:type I restriction enzyme S subunit